MTDFWKVHSFSLASAAGVFYILCAIFDALFPPFGLIATVSAHSPSPLFGSPLGFLSEYVILPSADLCSARSMKSHGISGAKDCAKIIDLDTAAVVSPAHARA